MHLVTTADKEAMKPSPHHQPLCLCAGDSLPSRHTTCGHRSSLPLAAIVGADELFDFLDEELAPRGAATKAAAT